MTRDDEACLKLGREVVRMINELRKTSQGETGYTRRKFTFPGGEVHMFIANDSKLADRLDATAAQGYEVQTVTPPSQLN